MTTLKTKSGVELYYKDWGKGQPVVFCHGWPLNADMWEYQMMFLAERGYRVIAHDRRGFGRSSQPWEGYDYDHFADDLAELINTLDLRNVTLVGFSMGGGEVARYLSRHGTGRVSKAVLVGAVTPFLLKTDEHPAGTPRSMFDGIRAGLLADRPQFFSEFGKLFTGANRPDSKVSQGLLTWTLSMALMASLKGTHDCVAAFSETDFRKDLAAFKLPTLVIHGDDDQIVPFDISGKLAAQMIPGTRLEVYPGAPHALYFTHKDRMNAELLSFIKG
jgi:pimeloyl-ACP methyl ester carboxylesterase